MRIVAEGPIQVKEELGGYRHYINDPENRYDIHCGTVIELLQATERDERLVKGDWIQGRYEGALHKEPPQAYFHFSMAYPSGYELSAPIPLGSIVRLVKE